jgi:hypothetical protein
MQDNMDGFRRLLLRPRVLRRVSLAWLAWTWLHCCYRLDTLCAHYAGTCLGSTYARVCWASQLPAPSTSPPPRFNAWRTPMARYVCGSRVIRIEWGDPSTVACTGGNSQGGSRSWCADDSIYNCNLVHGRDRGSMPDLAEILSAVSHWWRACDIAYTS